MIVDYEKENNCLIDVFVEHYTEYQLTTKGYENVHPKKYESAESNEFLDLEEVSDVDYKWYDNEYSMGIDDDNFFYENADESRVGGEIINLNLKMN